MKKNLSITSCKIAAILSLLALIPPPDTAHGNPLEQSAETRHEQAVELARQGKYSEALDNLSALHREYPAKKTFQNDYAAILSWAGRHEEALRLLPDIDTVHCPEYVLAALAASARHSKNFSIAENLYELGQSRFPRNLNMPIGRALVFADQQKTKEALDILEPMLTGQQGPTELYSALAYVYGLRREFTKALLIYDKWLALAPNSTEAYRGWVKTVSATGAATLAADLAGQKPALFSSTEMHALTGDVAASHIRWGILPPVTPPQRYEETDRALAILDRQLDDPELSPAERTRTRLDRIVALHDRFRMQEVLSEYEELAASGTEVPNYVLLSVANAYLHEEKPESARDACLKILASDKKNFRARTRLFYALVDLGDFPEAFAVIDQLDEDEPIWLWSTDGRLRHPNYRKTDTVTMATMARAYADELAEAQERLENMLIHGPNNTNIRQELGTVYRWRGWPSLAQHHYELALASEPNSINAGVGYGYALLDRHNFDAVDTQIAHLLAREPDNRQVRNLERDRGLIDMFHLQGRISSGRGDGDVGGNKDLEYETYLYAPAINKTIRPFAHGYYSRADFEEGRGDYQRSGIGLQYSPEDMTFETEISKSLGGESDIGVSLSGQWRMTDQWRIAGRMESFSTSVPLRAYRNGIDGELAEFSLQYRPDELRHYEITLQGLEFSDDNRRRSATLSGYQRLWQNPIHKINLYGSIYGSTNSAEETIYFNPKEDLAVNGTLEHDWLMYRRYERSMHQRVSVSLGRYEQAHESGGQTAGFRLEHDWRLSRIFAFSYGFGRSRNIYDGDPEYRTYYFATLDWSF